MKLKGRLTEMTIHHSLGSTIRGVLGPPPKIENIVLYVNLINKKKNIGAMRIDLTEKQTKAFGLLVHSHKTPEFSITLERT